MVDGREWVRVDKRKARAAWDRGETVMCCGCNMRPGGFWHPESYGDKIRFADLLRGFDSFADSMTFYGCDAERGKHLAWYVNPAGMRYDIDNGEWVPAL